MTGHYVGPVILASDEEVQRKQRYIEIFKSEVLKDIDLYTHKHVDARADLTPQAGNAISSDTAETVDHAVIARYVEFRAAQLTVKLQSVLDDSTLESADDLLPDDDRYRFHLLVGESFNDNALRPLAEYMHRFLVFGALYDWYSQFADNASQRLAQNYKQQADDAEEKISSVLRGPSIVKRPLQPFGPAQKIY